MKVFQRTQPDACTAFRLPRRLLETIDAIAAALDANRSQLCRRALTEYIRFHELDQKRESPSVYEERKTEAQDHVSI
jgi:metal-responsive CopG/Arc/MetJ family transcriptional regulator